MRGYEKITVLPPVARDWRGDPVAGQTPQPFDIEGCTIWPRTSTEDNARGQIVIEGYNVFVPAPGVVTEDDQVRVRGEDKKWEVDGPPGDYRKKGRPLGLLVVLKRVGS